MNTIIKCIVLASLCLIIGKTQAQDTLQKNQAELRIERLIQFKDSITQHEKASLKSEVETIHKRFEKGEITKLQADTLKQEMAEKRALNIENRLSIVDSQIALIKRNPEYYAAKQAIDTNFVISIGQKKIMSFAKDSTPKYDIRTSNKLLFTIGFNNTIMDSQSLEDSPYEIGGSGFVELGWIWSTRVLKNSNFMRVNYGLAFQWNKLTIKDNQYFVENGKETALETYPLNLKKSKFRTTSLVVPVHFEFGPSKLKDYGDRIRYFNDNQFKIGLGGFAGLNLSTVQKLKYEVDGNSQKEKIRSDFNTNSLVYGISGYVGVGDFSIYAKYNLNTVFKNQDVDQRNVSLGLRWALD